MSYTYEQGGRPELHEVLLREYGEYIVDGYEVRPFTEGDLALQHSDNITLVTQQTWQETITSLSTHDFGRTTVVTPELITLTNLPQDENPMPIIRQRLAEAMRVSRDQPDATFIIGSPFQAPYVARPYNAAVILEGGQIIALERKRILAGEEARLGMPAPEAEPTSVKGATVLVCRDMLGAQQVQTSWGHSAASYVERLTGDQNLAKKYTSTRFIAPGTERILVSSCWAVGLPEGTLVPGDTDADWHYRKMLQHTARTLLNTSETLRQIIVCDRAPRPGTPPMSLVLTKG